jgi:hypothetical protein
MNESARNVYGDGTAIVPEEVVFLNKFEEILTKEEDKAMLFNCVNLLSKHLKNENIVQDAVASVAKAREELTQMRKEQKLYRLIANLAHENLRDYDF